MLEKHHITFKGQGGLDFELNYKYLSSEDHRGNKGPHKSREKDLKYKRELQLKLEEILDIYCSQYSTPRNHWIISTRIRQI